MSMHRCTVTGPKPTWLRPLLPSQLGRPWAAGLLTALVVLSPALEPAVMLGVESWVSSRALGQSSMRHFLQRAVPRNRQQAFIRSVACVCEPTGSISKRLRCRIGLNCVCTVDTQRTV